MGINEQAPDMMEKILHEGISTTTQLDMDGADEDAAKREKSALEQLAQAIQSFADGTAVDEKQACAQDNMWTAFFAKAQDKSFPTCPEFRARVLIEWVKARERG